MLDLLKRTFTSPSSISPELVEGEHQLYLPTENKTITYQLKLSKRRTSLSIEIKQHQIQVKAPYWSDLNVIESFLIKKQSWIIEKQQQQRIFPVNLNTYQTGSKLLLFGHWLTLTVNHGSKFQLSLTNDERLLIMTIPRHIKKPQQYVRSKLVQFYIQQAQQYVSPKLQQLQQEMNLQAKALEFKVYKRRWGCCYASGLIRINPMLMGAPHWVIDCVLIHELSHLTHMDHSSAFWQLNKQYCEHCDLSKKWLFEHSHALTLL
ncbi:M48 family metallopeptidase [Psychrosphaera sp. F3M07]|uniref:M48 family metallopeptidase n=1 Tax=Psychrosphaera sp. F3M07 TaxID=2841560 RepID=UPI001C08BADA|nr:SprT family zinc-dependent metalloprotease [Psychrosphaera sp. F3M07]MBU2919638.1 M48 family metallopeptidase [Psychrosphaera sp. F3M07]